MRSKRCGCLWRRETRSRSQSMADSLNSLDSSLEGENHWLSTFTIINMVRIIKEMVEICLQQLFPYSWIVLNYIWYRNSLVLTQRQVWQHVYANLSGPWTFCRHLVFGAVTPVQSYAHTALLSLVIVQWKTWCILLDLKPTDSVLQSKNENRQKEMTKKT